MSAARPAVGRRTVVCLGISQLVCWGISYYLIGVFGELIAADLGWSRTLVYGGFSIALLAMGIASPLVGRLIDRLGGARVMSLGSVLCALGTAGLALAHDVAAYYAAWICLGVAMRAILYDAAFAALARIGGPDAGRPIAQVTLLGGLASTCFWPIGHLLADAFGWRGALAVYALIALATLPLHMAIPKGRYEDARPASGEPARPQAGRRDADRACPALRRRHRCHQRAQFRHVGAHDRHARPGSASPRRRPSGSHRCAVSASRWHGSPRCCSAAGCIRSI